MTQLDGRVFTRLQQYNNLPTELKREVEELEKYLKKIQAEICYPHHTLKLKTVYGVRKQVLLGKIDEWVKSHPHGAGHGVGQSLDQGHGVGHGAGHDHGSTAAAHATGSDGVHASSTSTGTSTSKTERVKDDVMHPTSHGHTQTHGTDPYASKTERIKDDLKHRTSHGNTHVHGADATTKSHHGTTATTSPETNTNVGNNQVAGSASPATGSVPPVSIGKGGATGHTPHAEKLLDALVLKGFVTPHKEDKPKNATPATDLDFKNNELFVARGKGIASPEAIDAGPSVWDLVDGAVFAGMIKRKAGLLEPLIHGKDTYAVVNSRLKTLALFKTDLSRKPIAQFSGRSLHVSFDKTHYEHGVKVWNETESSLLNTATQSESDALVEALIAIGASHRDGLDRAHAPAVTTGEKVREEAKKAVGVDDANTRHQSHGMYKSPAGDHITPVSPDGSNRIPDQQHTRHPTHTSESQEQHQHHGMEKQGLGGENRNAVLGNQPGDKTQYQAQGLPTANDNLKREHGEPRGFAQVSDPTMTP